MINDNLVGGFNLPLWKMMEWKSVGMMTFHSQLFLESLIKFHGSSHHQPDSIPHQDPRINQGQVSHPTVPLFGTMISFLSLYA